MTQPVLVDTHCHLDFDRYDEDRAQVIDRAVASGLAAIVNPAIDLANSATVCELAAEEPSVFAAVGVHPNSAVDFQPSDADQLRVLAGRDKVVAVGEIGLDYYWDRCPRDVQWRVFEAQLTVAAALGLPVIIHNREATDDVLAILADWVAALEGELRSRPGVLHSFSASPEAAQRTLDLGFYIGITGPVTFKKADELRVVAAMVPADRLLLETDGPFLTPHPYRGKRNEPAYVEFVADRIAGVRLSTLHDIARQTSLNAQRLFNLPLGIQEV